MKHITSCCLVSLAMLQSPTTSIDFSAGHYAARMSNPTTSASTAAASRLATSPKDWKIGVQLWTFHFVTFAEALNKADSAGVKNVEAIPWQKLGGGLPGNFDYNMTDSTRMKVKELLKAKGIHIYAMGVVTARSIDEWKKYFDLAKYFGLSYITCEPLKNQWDAIDSLAAIYHINLAIHDHPRPNAYWSPDSVLAATKGHPHIGSCADIGHWARNGLDPVECLRKLEGHIFGVHLKDIDTLGHTNAKDLIVGTGAINYPPVFEELKRQNFKGYFSIEREDNWYHNVPDVIATVKYFNQQVSKL
jgi:sugar phosphate isomerase/epimerase